MNAARIWTVLALCLLCCVALAGRAPGADGSGPRDNDALVHQLLTQGEDASRRWMNGDSTGYANLMAHSDRLTIFGPLGGPSPDGWSDGFARAQAAGARQFRGGISSTVELVQSYVSDSLVVVVKIERNKVRLGAREQPEEWVERSTEVYARQGSEWKIVHRHSDPLIERRSLSETLELQKR
jgi:ketosteroid isomerase-like protein